MLRTWFGEYPARVTYRRSLELLLQGDGALVLGVDDAGYMPSKLATYAYSGKPLLACLHRDGPALAMLRERAGARPCFVVFANPGDAACRCRGRGRGLP